MTGDFEACAFLWLGIVLLTALGAKLQRSWLAPGPMTGLTWVVAAGLPLLVVPDYPTFVRAYLAVGGFVLAAMLGSSLGLGQALPVDRGFVPDARTLDRAFRHYAVFLAIAMLSPILIYREARQLVSVGSLADLALETSIARYRSEFTTSLASRLPMIFGYAAALVSGFLFPIEPPRRRSLVRSFAWTVPLVAAVMVNTAKATLLYGTVLWIGGWLAGVAFMGQYQRIRMRRLVLGLGLASIGILVFAVVSQGLRMGRRTFADVPFLLDHMRGYVSAHMAVFGHWLDTALRTQTEHSWGIRTFAGIADLLGVQERRQGLYDAGTSFATSNIYTAGRPLMEDFGPFGSFVFAIGLGWAGGLGCRLALARNVWGPPLLAAFTAFVLWSPITSIFVYNQILGAFIVFAIWCAWFVPNAGATR